VEADVGRGGHEPVLLAAYLEACRPGKDECWVDGTMGRGGHSEAMLEAGASVLGLDGDEAAVGAAAEWGRKWPGRMAWQRRNFADLEVAVREHGWEGVDGVLLDLGVSSPQLETAERGFSFRLDGPLDMRMDQREPLTAAAIVNTWDEGALAKLFYERGGEQQGRRVARAILRSRERRPFARTSELADCVAAAVGRHRAGGIHPATKVFQALRLAVNRELESLMAALPQATRLLRPGGRLAVISFHSGEDRLVKNYLRQHAAEWQDTPEHPQSFRNVERYFDRVGRWMPSENEVERNPRSRSARLRVGYRNQEPMQS
jgi:16S rRNA (cytosine1402-N4)-methyltransferase